MNDRTIYIAGQLFFLTVLFVVNTLSARVLGPERMGVWNLVNLVAEYGFIATLGIISGMAREIPLNLGRADRIEVARVTLGSFAMLGVINLLLIALAAILFRLDDGFSSYYVMGILLLVCRIMNSYTYILIRSWQHFSFLGVQQLVMGGVQILCLLIFLWSSSISALLLITVIPLLAGSLFAARYLPSLRNIRFDAGVAVRLIAEGFPIYMAALLYSFFVTTDRLLITRYLGVKSLGLYTPALIAVSIIALAPTFVANIMYPKLTELFGRTGNYAQLQPSVRLMMIVNVASTFCLAIVLFLSFKLLIIPRFLPEYSAGLYPMGILLLAAIVSSVGHGYGDLFNATGRQRVFLVNVACGLAVNVAAGYLLLRYSGMELMSVSLGTLIAVTVYSILQVVTAKRVLNEQMQSA